MSDATRARVSVKPPRPFRKLRIGVSVFFGVLTLLICMLWVRSFWRMDGITWSAGSFVMVTSNDGIIVWSCISPNPLPHGPSHPTWEFASVSADSSPMANLWKTSTVGQTIGAPHLLTALVPAVVACLPWVTGCFSLRTLFIATTLVAAVLGVGIWLAF